MSGVDMLPCPLCGSGPAISIQNASFSGVELLYWHGLHFVNCGTCSLEGPKRETQTEAIAAWNIRAPVSAVKVKALEWDKLGDAKGGGAKYSVYEFGGGCLWNCVCYPHEDHQYLLAYGVSQEAAKAAAQADYEARIISAIA